MSDLEPTSEWRLPTSAQFQDFFAAKLAPRLVECEQVRLRTVANVRLYIGVIVALILLGSLLFFVSGGGLQQSGFWIMLAAVVGFIVSAAAYGKIVAGYRRRFKGELVLPIIQFFGPDFTYNPEGFVPRSTFQLCRIFDHSIDRYNGEDLIGGTAGKTRFECSEVHAEYKTTTTDSKGNRSTQWHTIFKGLFFMADFNKHFNATTLVLPDQAQAALGWLGQKLQGMNFSRPGSLVKLEDPEFEKYFVVYSTDQVEARYILSPSLMRRLLDYRLRINRPIHLAFIADHVFLAVDLGHNLLEPKLFSPLNFDACYASFTDLHSILLIIEELNLNLRIWSKQ